MQERMKFGGAFALLIALVMILSVSTPSYAQSARAEINGVVSDPTGAVIIGAKITVTNSETGLPTPLVSNEAGQFYARALFGGLYDIRVEAPGFKTFSVSGVEVTTGMNLEFPIELEVGDVTEVVEVTAEAVAQLQTATGDVSSLVVKKTVDELPTITRRLWELVSLTPAVTPVYVFYGSLYMPFMNIGGNLTNGNMWYVDGNVITLNRVQAYQLPVFNPPTEIVQEMRVETSNYSAEFGQTAGAVILTTTRSGTNSFAGQAYYYGRNDKLDARDFFAATRPINRFHNYGYLVGGPIVKNRTHFMWSHEKERWLQPGTLTTTIPTQAMVRGDFSQVLNADGSLQQIFDPATVSGPAGGETRLPFPNNQIPSDRSSSVASQMLAFYPDPSQAGDITGGNNFTNNLLALDLDRIWTFLRIDHQFNDANRLYFRWTRDPFATPRTGPYSGTRGEIADPWAETNDLAVKTLGVSLSSVITPTLISDVRVGWNNVTLDRAWGKENPEVWQQDWAKRIGLRNVSPATMPSFQPTGFSRIGRGQQGQAFGFPVMRAMDVDAVINNVRGNHSLKLGTFWRHSRGANSLGGWLSGRTLYDSRATAQFADGSAVGTTGNPIASMLIGHPFQGQIQNLPAPDFRTWYLAAFFNDDWRITPNLTLNLGVRWEYDAPKRDVTLQFTFFNFDDINPISGTPGIVEFSRNKWIDNGFVHTPAYNDVKDQIAPRVGFAYKVLGRDDLVLRGGYGMFFTGPDVGDAFWGAPMAAAGIEADFVTVDGGLTPAFDLDSEGIPAPPPIQFFDGFGAVPFGQSPGFNPGLWWPNRDKPYTQQINLGMQKQQGAFLFEVAGIANIARKLHQGRNYNELLPSLRGPGNKQTERPFAQFGNVSGRGESMNSSNYYGLILQMRRQFSKGLSFNTNYTFSRWTSTRFRGFYDRDWGTFGNQRKHNYKFSGVYELPFGKGRQRLTSGPLAGIFGNWTMGGIVTVVSGGNLSFGVSSNTCNSFGGCGRPDLVGDPGSGPSNFDPGRDTWFNTAAFAHPQDAGDPFRDGTAGFGILEGPYVTHVDLNVSKEMVITERMSFAISIEMTNMFNRTNFGSPNTTQGNPGFGTIGGTCSAFCSQAGGPRQMQFGGKFMWGGG